MIEDFVIKYAWSAVSPGPGCTEPCWQLTCLVSVSLQAGYLLISIPVFFGQVLPPGMLSTTSTDKGTTIASSDDIDGEAEAAKVAHRTENYISNRRLLLALADAGGRLMSSYKDMAELAGYTSRVFTLLSTLHELDVGRFQGADALADGSDGSDHPVYDLGHINGVVVQGCENVEFEKTPIVAPAPGLARGGEELVKSLNIIIRPGEHLLITGANVGVISLSSISSEAG